MNIIVDMKVKNFQLRFRLGKSTYPELSSSFMNALITSGSSYLIIKR